MGLARQSDRAADSSITLRAGSSVTDRAADPSITVGAGSSVTGALKVKALCGLAVGQKDKFL